MYILSYGPFCSQKHFCVFMIFTYQAGRADTICQSTVYADLHRDSWPRAVSFITLSAISLSDRHTDIEWVWVCPEWMLPSSHFFFLNNRLSHYTLVTHFLYCNYYLISILTYFLIKIFKHVQKLGFDLLYFSYTSGKVLVSSRLFSSPVLPCPLF